MEQMNVPDDWKIPVDFDDPALPDSVKNLRPLVYQEGEDFCCVLGPDPQEGVFGCGPSVEEALNDWDAHVKDRVKYHKDDDEVARFIEDSMKTDGRKVW